MVETCTLLKVKDISLGSYSWGVARLLSQNSRCARSGHWYLLVCLGRASVVARIIGTVIAESAGPDTRGGTCSQLQVGNSIVIAKDSIYSFWDAVSSVAYQKQQISVRWISQRAKGNGSAGKYNLCQGGKDKTSCYLVMSCYIPLTVIFWLNREPSLSLVWSG